MIRANRFARIALRIARATKREKFSLAIGNFGVGDGCHFRSQPHIHTIGDKKMSYLSFTPDKLFLVIARAFLSQKEKQH